MRSRNPRKIERGEIYGREIKGEIYGGEGERGGDRNLGFANYISLAYFWLPL